MAAASGDEIQLVCDLSDIKLLVRRWRGPSPPLVDVFCLPLRDCPAAALLLRRLARHDRWVTSNLSVVEYAASLDRYLQTMAAVRLPRLLLADTNSDSDSDIDPDEDVHNSVLALADHIDRAMEMAVQVGGSVVAEVAGLAQICQKLPSAEDTSRDLLVEGTKAEVARIRSATIRFREPPDPQVSVYIQVRASPPPPRLGPPPPSPTPSPLPSPPTSPPLDDRFRSLPAGLPARRTEVWAPEHEIVDGLDGIRALLKCSHQPPLLLVNSLATRDCPQAFALLHRLTKHAQWNVPELHAIEHASKLDAVLKILSKVTIPRLLLIPLNDRNEAHLEPLKNNMFNAVVEGAEAGGSIVGELKWVEESARKLEANFLELNPISQFARYFEIEICRVRNCLIRFSDPPEPEAALKYFFASPSPPPLGSPPQTPSP
jgi:uncharacterized protein with PIN domain